VSAHARGGLDQAAGGHVGLGLSQRRVKGGAIGIIQDNRQDPMAAGDQSRGRNPGLHPLSSKFEVRSSI
jgi:hypothetical protein